MPGTRRRRTKAQKQHDDLVALGLIPSSSSPPEYHSMPSESNPLPPNRGRPRPDSLDPLLAIDEASRHLAAGIGTHRTLEQVKVKGASTIKPVQDATKDSSLAAENLGLNPNRLPYDESEDVPRYSTTYSHIHLNANTRLTSPSSQVISRGQYSDHTRTILPPKVSTPRQNCLFECQVANFSIQLISRTESSQPQGLTDGLFSSEMQGHSAGRHAPPVRRYVSEVLVSKILAQILPHRRNSGGLQRERSPTIAMEPSLEFYRKSWWDALLDAYSSSRDLG